MTIPSDVHAITTSLAWTAQSSVATHGPTIWSRRCLVNPLAAVGPCRSPSLTGHVRSVRGRSGHSTTRADVTIQAAQLGPSISPQISPRPTVSDAPGCGGDFDCKQSSVAYVVPQGQTTGKVYLS